MERIFRWSLRILLVVMALGAIALALVYYFASRSLPDYDANWRVNGVAGEVEIVRDTANVPHIFAAANEDVFYGLGFAHAQDRLWQMMLLRRTAQGRLSELFGARTVKTDELLRRLDLYGAAEASVPDQDAETTAALEAYADGVNAWLAQVNEKALGRGAPEFFLFAPEIAPWRPADSLAVIKLMALQLSAQAQHEVLRARASLALEPQFLQDLMPRDPGTARIELAYAEIMEGLDVASALGAPAQAPFMSPVPKIGEEGASNAWAAAPSRSAAGGTLLANDPHLEFTAPSIWYLARLDLSTGGVIGGTIPGMPFVMLGRSASLGWGMTSAYVDDQDLYMEELNPGDASEYRTPRGWQPFRTERSIIRVKDAAPVTITLRWTENGPVIPGSHWDLGSVTPPGHVAALAWTALSPDDTTASAGMRLMRARDVDAAIAAGEEFIAPAQNVTLVDRDRIAFRTFGVVPARDPAHESQGRMPSLGWKEQNRWQGRMPYDDNPGQADPEGGVLGNTNNKTVNRPFPNHVSYVWGDTQRIQRLTRLMGERDVHTRESFIAAQLDTVSPTARLLLPLVARDLWYQGEAAPDGTAERQRQVALEMLANWNGEMNEHLPEPLIYAAWMKRLQDKLIVDDLGPLAAAWDHPDPVFLERVFRNTGGAARWCDIRQSSFTETCTDIARIALDEALIEIESKWGGSLESLRWGDAHEAHHDHPVLGEAPILKWFVNIRQSTSGGDFTLRRGRTAGTGPDPFSSVHGAGYRGVYDFADPDSSVFITATGQSGHPLSRHYDDLGELWRRGEYIPMTLDPALARAGATGITRLIPR
ncbi:penicillin acylase family protein [Tropicimonas sp. IMCC34011]|uniref:penicillin acylase family protein n=1 Tax=Tropicimonas sp. IMCC34011 TaxID=2248759 RepID=UPI000E234F90|nr:penicillin acylase family protein [Tropicimonas sp. IMCC34011]